MKSAELFSLYWLAEVDHENQSKSTYFAPSSSQLDILNCVNNDLIYYATYWQKVQLPKRVFTFASEVIISHSTKNFELF